MRLDRDVVNESSAVAGVAIVVDQDLDLARRGYRHVLPPHQKPLGSVPRYLLPYFLKLKRLFSQQCLVKQDLAAGL